MNNTKQKVLIVDDDELLAQALAQVFVNRGYDTKVLSTGNDVEATIESWNPDVILLDIMLPGKTGVEIVSDVSIKHKELCNKIVVMTTLEDSEYLAKVLELGVTHYVQKNTANPEYVFEVASRILNH
jgi:DNA-binding response OmpR family regulator